MFCYQKCVATSDIFLKLGFYEISVIHFINVNCRIVLFFAHSPAVLWAKFQNDSAT